MKKLFIIFSILFSIFTTTNAKTVTFVNKLGVFERINTDIFKKNPSKYGGQVGSFTHTAENLGYSPNEISGSCFAKVCGKSVMVGVEPITKSIVFIMIIDEGNCPEKLFFEDIKFEKDLIEYFNDGEICSILDRGIKDKNIHLSTYEKIFHTKAINNKISCPKYGFTFIFKNGILVNYKTNDGLDTYGKYVKHGIPSLFNVLKTNAERKHSTYSDIVKEINFQSKCACTMPTDNVRLSYDSPFNHNIALVWFALYGKGSSYMDFCFYVPEAKKFEEKGNKIVMKFKSLYFIFENKKLQGLF